MSKVKCLWLNYLNICVAAGGIHTPEVVYDVLGLTLVKLKFTT